MLYSRRWSRNLIPRDRHSGLFRSVASRLQSWPSGCGFGSGELWDLLSGGAVLRINPRTGQVQPLVDLRSMPVDTGHVFDLASGTVGPFTGMLPQNSIYGDIALLRRGGRLDVFISGVSVAFPFILRIRIENGRVAATVVAASRASGAGYGSGPRGVAVSPQGLVLTTLPTRYLNEEEIMDRMVAFSADYSEGQAPAPTAISREQLFSAGMDADGAGKFLYCDRQYRRRALWRRGKRRRGNDNGRSETRRLHSFQFGVGRLGRCGREPRGRCCLRFFAQYRPCGPRR